MALFHNSETIFSDPSAIIFSEIQGRSEIIARFYGEWLVVSHEKFGRLTNRTTTAKMAYRINPVFAETP